MKLGHKLRDMVTGFEGIAVGRSEFLNGCVQFCLKAPARDGKIEDGQWFDSHQLQFVDDGLAPVLRPDAGVRPAATTGGPMETPRDRYVP